MTEADNPTAPSAQTSPLTESENSEIAELRLLVAKYEKKFEEVADLITKVRHEINNPLTGVLGQAQLLLREDLNEKSRKRVTTIEEQATRIRDIVAELRQVQRGVNG